MEAVLMASDNLLLKLSDEQELLNTLLKLAEQKEACLVQTDVTGLNGIMEKEEELVAALNEREEERKTCAGVLASAVGLSGTDLQLKDIIDKITDPHIKESLSAARTRLTDSVRKLTVLNAKIKDLLKLQIDYTDMMLNLLFAPKSKSQSYNKLGGRRDEADSLNLLDYHA